MWGSLESPGISGYELRETIGQLTGAIMMGTVETELVTASGEPLCTGSGAALAACQTLRPQEAHADTDIPAALWPLVWQAVAAESAAVERRVTDNIMGALMAGNISSTLADRTGAAVATRRGETIAAHRKLSADSGQTIDNMPAGLFPLFERMIASSNH